MSRPAFVRNQRRGFVLGVFLAASLFLSAPAGAAQSLDGIVGAYQGHASLWLSRLAPLARDLFAYLAALEFAVAGLVWMFEGRTADVILRGIVRKVLLLGLFWTLIAFFPNFVPNITFGFEKVGQVASDTEAISPSSVIDQGIFVTAQIFDNVTTAGLLAHPAGTFLFPLVALLILLAHVSIAAQLVLVLVESYLVVTSGILFLGFAGFRGTATLADNYLRYAFRVGVKIFLLYMLVAVGSDFVDSWTQNLLDISFTLASLRPIFEVLGGTLVYAFLVWRLPGEVASQLTETAPFGLREALGR